MSQIIKQKLCGECNTEIKDKHEHQLIGMDDHTIPACCECYNHLTGNQCNIFIGYWGDE